MKDMKAMHMKLKTVYSPALETDFLGFILLQFHWAGCTEDILTCPIRWNTGGLNETLSGSGPLSVPITANKQAKQYIQSIA